MSQEQHRKHSMIRVDTLAQFPFTDLPTEINFLILTYAARPTFSQAGPLWYGRSYHSSALALCCVSRTVRRIILPELLHTVFLVTSSDVLAFMHALHMQSAYAQQKNHLHVDYAAYVHRIWISDTLGNPFEYNIPRWDNIDFSLLAPVLLAAQFLALDFKSLFLLNGCLEYAWNSHARSYPLTNTAQERVFLASISYLIIFPYIISNVYRRSELDGDKQLNYILPKWMDSFPWASLKSLRAVSVVLPHVTVVADCCGLAPLYRKDVPMELLTFSAPKDLLSGNWVQKERKVYTGRGEIIPSVDICGSIVNSSDSSLVVLEVFLDWEQDWALGK